MSAHRIKGSIMIADMTRRIAYGAVDPDGDVEELERMTLPKGCAWLLITVPHADVPRVMDGAPVVLHFGDEKGERDGR